MPPSGFSQKAIDGLLLFVRDTYQNTLEKYKSQDLSEKEILNKVIGDLEKHVESVASSFDSVVSKEALSGLKDFVTINFYDLLQEIQTGKKKEGYAMQREIDIISTYLKNFHI